MRLTSIPLRLLPLCVMLSGCVLMRAVDDGVSGTLEQVPALKALGVESRKSQEQRKAAAAGQGGANGAGTEAGATAKAGRGKGAAAASGDAGLPASTGRKLSLQLLLCAARWVNPGPDDRPAPLRLRLMELTTAEHFSSAGAAELMAETKPAAWAADIRDQRDIVIPPGGAIELGWLTGSDSLLGIVGDFRSDPDAPQSRLLLRLDDRPTAGWIVYARGGTLNLLPRDDGATPAASPTPPPPGPDAAHTSWRCPDAAPDPLADQRTR